MDIVDFDLFIEAYIRWNKMKWFRDKDRDKENKSAFTVIKQPISSWKVINAFRSSDKKDTLYITKQRVIIRGFEFKRLKNIQSFCRQSFSLVPVLHTDGKAIWRY